MSAIAGMPPGLLRFLGDMHGHSRRLAARIVSVGALAGAFEATALLLFMDAVLRIAVTGESSENIGPIAWSASPTATLGISAVFIVAAALLHGLMAKLTTDGSLVVLAHAQQRILRSTLGARWSHQADAADGSMLTAVTYLATAASRITMFLMVAVNALVIAVALLVAAVIVAPEFTLVLAASLVPILLLLGPAGRYAGRRSRAALDEVTDLHEEIAASESMGLEIQAFGVQEQQLAALDDHIGAAFRAQNQGRFSARLAGYWFKDLALLTFILVVLLLDLVWDLSEASASAVLVIIIRALGYLHQSYNATRATIEFVPSVVELEAQLTSAAENSITPGGLALEKIGTLTFDNVTYKYPDGRRALQGTDLTIEPGRAVGIVGRSGAGKSTIAELILRLREPSSGAIRLDGVSTDRFDLDDWRRRVTFVPQDARVWRRTIAENITFLRTGYEFSEIERASRLAHLHEDVVALDGGYDTVLGSRSRGLSGGQRQRLAIARALLSDPWLIVFDEPTSALDVQSEQDLQKTLEGLRGVVTVIVIAHRTSTLDFCDDLIVVDQGRVVASGPRKQVIADSPFFKMGESGLDLQ